MIGAACGSFIGGLVFGNWWKLPGYTPAYPAEAAPLNTATRCNPAAVKPAQPGKKNSD
jgi:hypothetical protein